MKEYRTIFIDLDGTIINTVSGHTFPEDITDFRIRKDVLDVLRKMTKDGVLHDVCIVTNQGGIPQYVSEQDFETKLMSIRTFVSGYIGRWCHVKWCTSLDKDNPRRKPNTGMLKEFLDMIGKNISKAQCLMVGDASGKPGDFSDSDNQTAVNFGIDYMDVEDFVKLYS